jgi:peptide/nickel transport system permease protein
MGFLSAAAIHGRDYQLVTGTAILAAVVVVLGNLVTDVTYWFADPRTRIDA